MLSEPSVVAAMDAKTEKGVAVGVGAKTMIRRTSAHIVVTQPLKDGLIADFEVTDSTG